MDFGELLFCAVTLDANCVAQVLVARRHGRIDSEEAAEIDFAVGVDCQAFEGDSAHRALRHVTHHHAGVERCNQMFLRISETVRTSQRVRFIDVDREPARHPFSTDFKTLDLRTAPRLALPGRGDAPVCPALCRFTLDALDQPKQLVDIDAIDYGGFGSLRLCGHTKLLWSWRW